MAQESVARPRPTESNKRLGIFLGIGLGAVAAILVFVALSNSSGGGSQKVVPATRVAVVAARDIPAHTRLTPDMLKVSTFKIEDVNSDAFTTVGQLSNRVTASDITAGQVVTPSLVSDTAGQGLTFTVDPGMRAVSIGVKEVVTAGGNIVPGNQVDVIAVVDLSKGADVNSIISVLTGQPAGGAPSSLAQNGILTLTLLQNVKVLAVAQTLPNEPAASPSGTNAVPNENPNPRAATVTLEVTPQQAQLLAFADNHATLRLSLRPFGEVNTAPVSPVLTLLGQ